MSQVYNQEHYNLHVYPQYTISCRRKKIKNYEAEATCKYCGAKGETTEKLSVSGAKEWAIRKTTHDYRCVVANAD